VTAVEQPLRNSFCLGAQAESLYSSDFQSEWVDVVCSYSLSHKLKRTQTGLDRFDRSRGEIKQVQPRERISGERANFKQPSLAVFGDSFYHAININIAQGARSRLFSFPFSLGPSTQRTGTGTCNIEHRPIQACRGCTLR